MSITHVRGCADVAARVDYLVVGVGAKRRAHLEAKTDRVAAMSCDAGSLTDFVALARAHGRKVQAQSLILSFGLDDLRPDKPEDVQLCCDLAGELADRAYPGAAKLVVVHTDGDGHDGCGAKVHAHVLAINHDVTTGKALRSNRRHHDIAKLNDELMAENGLSVIGREQTPGTQLDHWAARRQELTEGGKTFDAELLGHCQAALADPSVGTWDEYVAALEGRGVTVRVDEHEVKRGDETVTSTGVTYSMLDTTGPKHRSRRRKASKLSRETTWEGAHEALGQKQAQKTAPAPAAPPQPPPAPVVPEETEEEARPLSFDGLMRRGPALRPSERLEDTLAGLLAEAGLEAGTTTAARTPAPPPAPVTPPPASQVEPPSPTSLPAPVEEPRQEVEPEPAPVVAEPEPAPVVPVPLVAAEPTPAPVSAERAALARQRELAAQREARAQGRRLKARIVAQAPQEASEDQDDLSL